MMMGMRMVTHHRMRVMMAMNDHRRMMMVAMRAAAGRHWLIRLARHRLILHGRGLPHGRGLRGASQNAEESGDGDRLSDFHGCFLQVMTLQVECDHL